MPSPTLTMRLLHSNISAHLAMISEMLPEGYKLTLVARNPSNPKAHIVIGNDEDTEAVAYVIEHQELTPVEVK